MNEVLLRKVQNCQLDMALEVKRICEKYNLRYFLAYGSMLGAIRHQGFIPWDDDLDIGMPREDYEKFIEISKVELCDDYELITWRNDKGFGNVYLKIMIKNTAFEEQDMIKVDAKKGIFIDIFPYDNYPESNNSLIRFRVKLVRFLLYCKCKYSFVNYNNLYKAISKVIFILLLPFSKTTICTHLEKLEKKFNSMQTLKIQNYNAGSHGKDWIYSSDPDNCISMLFEGYYLNVIENYDEFLSHYYGDYMTPPSVDKRENRHGISKLSFGDYTIKNPINR